MLSACAVDLLLLGSGLLGRVGASRPLPLATVPGAQPAMGPGALAPRLAALLADAEGAAPAPLWATAMRGVPVPAPGGPRGAPALPPIRATSIGFSRVGIRSLFDRWDARVSVASSAMVPRRAPEAGMDLPWVDRETPLFGPNDVALQGGVAAAEAIEAYRSDTLIMAAQVASIAARAPALLPRMVSRTGDTIFAHLTLYTDAGEPVATTLRTNSQLPVVDDGTPTGRPVGRSAEPASYFAYLAKISAMWSLQTTQVRLLTDVAWQDALIGSARTARAGDRALSLANAAASRNLLASLAVDGPAGVATVRMAPPASSAVVPWSDPSGYAQANRPYALVGLTLTGSGPDGLPDGTVQLFDVGPSIPQPPASFPADQGRLLTLGFEELLRRNATVTSAI